MEIDKAADDRSQLAEKISLLGCVLARRGGDEISSRLNECNLLCGDGASVALTCGLNQK